MRMILRCLLFAFVSAAAFAAEEKASEAYSLYVNLQCPQTFMAEREGFNQWAQERKMPDDQAREINQLVAYTDYEKQLIAYIGSLFTPDELHAVNAYLASSIGRREYAEMRAMLRELKAGTLQAADIDKRRDQFYQPLSDLEKKTITDFRATEPGKKYWQSLNPIHEKAIDIFHQQVKAAFAHQGPSKPDAVSSEKDK